MTPSSTSCSVALPASYAFSNKTCSTSLASSSNAASSNPSSSPHSLASASSYALLPYFKRRSTPAVATVGAFPFNVSMSSSCANHPSTSGAGRQENGGAKRRGPKSTRCSHLLCKLEEVELGCFGEREVASRDVPDDCSITSHLAGAREGRGSFAVD